MPKKVDGTGPLYPAIDVSILAMIWAVAEPAALVAVQEIGVMAVCRNSVRRSVGYGRAGKLGRAFAFDGARDSRLRGSGGCENHRSGAARRNSVMLGGSAEICGATGDEDVTCAFKDPEVADPGFGFVTVTGMSPDCELEADPTAVSLVEET